MAGKELESMDVAELIERQQELMQKREDVTRPVIEDQLSVQRAIDRRVAEEDAQRKLEGMAPAEREAMLRQLQEVKDLEEIPVAEEGGE